MKYISKFVMEINQKPNSFLIIGLFAVVLAFSAMAISMYIQNNGDMAEAVGSKQFDFGAANGAGMPAGVDSPHLVSHTQFHSVRLGDAVDAPETSPSDSGGVGDQDGLIFEASGSNGVNVNLWHTTGDSSSYFPDTVPQIASIDDAGRNRLGTIIAGYYKRVGDSYSFVYLGSAPVRWHHAPVGLSFAAPFLGNEEGWLRVIYTQLDLTTACLGNFIGCQTGFTQANLAGWDGTHGSLMNIMYGYPLSDPYDVSIPPGEIEDYLFLTKNGVTKYYHPNDPAFVNDGGRPTTGGGAPSGGSTPNGTEDENDSEDSSQIAGIFQPYCSPLVYFQVNISHPRDLRIDFQVQNSLDDGDTYEPAVVDSATALNGAPRIDNESDRQVQNILTDDGPETVSIAIDTEEFLEETVDKFRIRVIASDGRVVSQPIDTQSFEVMVPDAACHGAAVDVGEGDPVLNDPEGDPDLNMPDNDLVNDDVEYPVLPPVRNGINNTRVTEENVASLYNFLSDNGFDLNKFSKSIAREMATRIAIHILLLNDKILEEDIESETESIYPDSTVNERAGREITLATSLGIVQGYPNGSFYPYQNPTVVESYQIIAELGRYMSPEIARVLAEEKVKASGSPDWFEAYLQTFRRFEIPTGRNYFELGEMLTTLKFVELTQDIFFKVGLSDPFVRQPNLAEGKFRAN